MQPQPRLEERRSAAEQRACADKYAKMFKQKFGFSRKNLHISAVNHKLILQSEATCTFRSLTSTLLTPVACCETCPSRLARFRYYIELAHYVSAYVSQLLGGYSALLFAVLPAFRLLFGLSLLVTRLMLLGRIHKVKNLFAKSFNQYPFC